MQTTITQTLSDGQERLNKNLIKSMHIPCISRADSIDRNKTSESLLPPFSELVKLMDDRKAYDNVKMFGKSYTSGNIVSRDLSPIMNEVSFPYIGKLGSPWVSHGSKLAVLANISALKHYSLSNATKQREEKAFEFMNQFFSSVDSLTNCFEEMKSRLQDVTLKNDEFPAYSDESIYTYSYYKKASVKRTDFQNWITEIPDTMYDNISEVSTKLANVLKEMKNMKRNYKEEEKLMQMEKQMESEMKKKMNKDGGNESLKNDLGITKINTFNETKEIQSLSHELKKKNCHKIKVMKPTIKKSKLPVFCRHCGTVNTPEWRRGPEGSRTLCNACGLFYSKLSKKFGSARSALILNSRREKNQVEDRTIPFQLD